MGKNKDVIVVGNGYAGHLHAKAWRELGNSVTILDDAFSGHYVQQLIEHHDPDVIDFCNSPRYRIDRLHEYIHVFKHKEIFIEKPPCRPQDLFKYKEICDELNVTPMHNYCYMDLPSHVKLPLDVAILRQGPHKSWYTNTDLTGGGIMLDHAYHWLYLADSMGAKLENCKIWIDNLPDYECSICSDDFKMYASWKSPLRMTAINGVLHELRTDDMMVNSMKRIFELEYDEKTHLKNQSLKIMSIIHDAYDKLSFSIRKE